MLDQVEGTDTALGCARCGRQGLLSMLQEAQQADTASVYAFTLLNDRTGEITTATRFLCDGCYSAFASEEDRVAFCEQTLEAR